jgi:fatty acid desaturase
MDKFFDGLRVIVKIASFPFVLFGIVLFLWQFLPIYIGKGWMFYIFVVGIMLWFLDVEWSTIQDVMDIIEKPKSTKSQ